MLQYHIKDLVNANDFFQALGSVKINYDFAGGNWDFWRGANDEHTWIGLQGMSTKAQNTF